MSKKLMQVVALFAVCQTAHASTETQVPEFIKEFAVEVVSKAYSYADSSKVIDEHTYSVSVFVADKKCNVVVEAVEVEHRSLDGELLEPLFKPLAKSINCEPRS
tara:strand:- start:553 stop:864 length:312 start_codon:yes stop_codon:yes gene_type:complete